MRRRSLLAVGVITALLALLSQVAIASRAPTSHEKAAIVAAVRKKMSPQERPCAARMPIKVSTANRRYAWANWVFPGACSKYSANGASILEDKRGRWRVIFNGDLAVAPPCWRVPDKVSVDLWNGEHCRR